jgi:TonB family protein
MTAMTVPPPRWTSLSHRDLAESRRTFEQGLALSALAHLGALAFLLWLQAQGGRDVLLVYRAPANLIVCPAPPPPVIPRITGSVGGEAKSGTIEPRRDVDEPRLVLPTVDAKAGMRAGTDTGSGPPSVDPGADERLPVASGDPAEGAFVPFDEPPVPIYHPDPAYSEWAREQHIEGRVVLHALIGQDGHVRRVTVIRGVSGLTESAQEVLYRWTFRPAHVNRQPVAVWIEVPFEFRL